MIKNGSAEFRGKGLILQSAAGVFPCFRVVPQNPVELTEIALVTRPLRVICLMFAVKVFKFQKGLQQVVIFVLVQNTLEHFAHGILTAGRTDSLSVKFRRRLIISPSDGNASAGHVGFTGFNFNGASIFHVEANPVNPSVERSILTLTDFFSQRDIADVPVVERTGIFSAVVTDFTLIGNPFQTADPSGIGRDFRFRGQFRSFTGRCVGMILFCLFGAVAEPFFHFCNDCGSGIKGFENGNGTFRTLSGGKLNFFVCEQVSN